MNNPFTYKTTSSQEISCQEHLKEYFPNGNSNKERNELAFSATNTLQQLKKGYPQLKEMSGRKEIFSHYKELEIDNNHRFINASKMKSKDLINISEKGQGAPHTSLAGYNCLEGSVTKACAGFGAVRCVGSYGICTGSTQDTLRQVEERINHLTSRNH